METKDKKRENKELYITLKYEWSLSKAGRKEKKKKRKSYFQLREFHHTTSIKILSQQPSDEEILLPRGADDDQVPLDPNKGLPP